MSRVLPILFNTEDVRATLDGRKSVIRLMVESKTIIRNDQEINKNLRGRFELYDVTPRCGIPKNIFFKPPYQPGDILYVRETWQECCRCTVHSPIVHSKYCFKASVDDCPFYGCIEDCGQICNWRSSIYMPKEAARIWLRVTDVRAERLQDITAEQVVKEGITEFDMEHIKTLGEHYDIPFATLWNSTIKKSDLATYGWKANPWVWVIEFERCEKPEEDKD